VVRRQQGAQIFLTFRRRARKETLTGITGFK
jgi:hypothetical protein